MPAVTSGKILVTGANGYVAIWVIKDLLERGFSVRGTVRSPSKATYLKDRFKPYGDNLEVVIVPDMEQDDAFDKAASAGVVAIMHIASPLWHSSVAHPDEVIRPAVQGTTSILRTALKYRASIRRVILMSSCVAVFSEYPLPPGVSPTATRAFDERDWNDYAVELVREKGREADGWSTYQASKVLAERAAWRLYKRELENANNKGDSCLGWDMVVLNAPRVTGPVLHEVSSVESLSGTPGEWYEHVVKGDLQGFELTKEGFEWVDVRDLARAHVLALMTPGAAGERFIIRGGRAVWQDFVDAARQHCQKIPAGDRSYNVDDALYPFTYHADKSLKVLGLRYHTIEETTRDTMNDFATRGWL